MLCYDGGVTNNNSNEPDIMAVNLGITLVAAIAYAGSKKVGEFILLFWADPSQCL